MAEFNEHPPVVFAPIEPLGLSQTLPAQNKSNQIATLLVSGSQPRPGNNNPNAVLPPAGASTSTPQHVQSVIATIKKSSDVTTKVTVSFKRNPNDPLFSDAIIHVAGYNGNPAPVQVAKGQSPLSFSLNNTGEPVQIIAQANGNTGPAPLSGAPSTAIQVPRTPLATTPTTGGNGTGSSALVMPAEFVVSGNNTATITVTKATESANTVWAGPTSGAAAAPTFRALSALDLPPTSPLVGYLSAGGVAVSSWSTVGMSGTSVTGSANAIRGNGTDWMGVSYTTSSAATNSAGITFQSTAANDTSLNSIYLFEASVELPSTANIRVWIGFSDQVTNGGIGPMRSDTPGGNSAAFRYSTAAGDTKWQCVTSNAGTQTTTAETGSHLDTSRHTFRIGFDGTNVLFFIDGALVGAQSSHAPAGTTVMNWMVAIDNVGLANAKTVNIYRMVIQPK